jgi:hypothetical protein
LFYDPRGLAEFLFRFALEEMVIKDESYLFVGNPWCPMNKLKKKKFNCKSMAYPSRGLARVPKLVVFDLDDTIW